MGTLAITIGSKRRKPQRKTPAVPNFPQGLTVRQKLLYLEKPVTARVLAQIIGVSPITVFKQARAGRIPSFRIGAAVRFDTRRVAQWLEGNAR